MKLRPAVLGYRAFRQSKPSEDFRPGVLEQFSLLPEDLAELGPIATVVSARCDFKSPALTNDTIIIRTHLLKPHTASLTFQFEILRQSDMALLVRGETVQVLTHPDGTMIYKLGR